MSNAEPKSPLTIIAIFAGIIEASALASLPFLSEDSQTTYTWFLVGFPFFLTVLFFLTLNFNYKSLYSLPVQESTDVSTAPTSAQLTTAVESMINDVIQVPAELPISNEAINLAADNGTAHVPGNPPQIAQASVTITISGTCASQLLEHFAMLALDQTHPLCNNWTLINLETGIQTTLATQSINN
ncbi:hypothetical protein [Pseudomonas sp. BBP2017]|uniref:hypothetical protein n=1 Tax=Pseudomonas sp. BBP2017 TaxID=2109731 RepID=UPI0021154EDA|nr:hypothetical protein [Pseudomonas sp. BBP2017]